MKRILEPIVTSSQALKVTSNYVTISSMNNEMAEFAKRLNLVADQKRLPPKGSGRQGHMASLFGVSQKGARKWLEGEAIPKTARLNEIAKYFGVRSEWLLSGRGDMYDEESQWFGKVSEVNGTYETECSNCKKIPVLSHLQAGQLEKIAPAYKSIDASDWIETSAKVSRSSFALIAEGDSMVNPYGSPSIPEGAYVIIDPKIEATHGKIVLAKLNNSEGTMLKKLVIDGPNKYLKALNPEYKQILINEDFLILGVAKRIEIDL